MPTQTTQHRVIASLLGRIEELKLENAKLKNANLPLPPVDSLWPHTAQEIERNCAEILKATSENYNRIAAIPVSGLTYENCIEPLQAPPNYKTNPLLAATKFLQHCSTDEVVRSAAEQTTVRFSKMRVSKPVS